MSPKYFIKTYGCQMNLADSERLAGVLESAGYQATGDSRQADIILVNTCVVRKHAEDRAAGYISSLKGLKAKKPDLKIGVCGCLVTEPGRSAASLFPHVDWFIPPNSPDKLIKYINSALGISHSSLTPQRSAEGVTAWVTIMHGCDNFCSYCIVPYVRGREYSRPVDEVLREIEQIDLEKHPEIFLLGQNVNSYKHGLANLLREIELRITRYALPITRIRFMTSHPRDMTDEIINAVAEIPQVCEYFHLPIQHGDDEILARMNRGYTADYYRKLADKIRSRIPEAAITSDVIVGFPGETDEQFRSTLYIIEQIGFDACNTSAYSVRPGTSASRLPDDVPQKVKHERLQEVMKMVENVASKRNEKLVGSTREILVDSIDDKRYIGRTRGNKIVKFSSEKNNLLGKRVNVRITSAKSWVLKGELTNGKF
jgi:tRNA-2-methylthio-N6-dimethylallyladenosine synthase